ncbi:MAG TPA: DUF6542 domain-containing protein [Streptosporangiaceae bacterium]
MEPLPHEASSGPLYRGVSGPYDIGAYRYSGQRESAGAGQSGAPRPAPGRAPHWWGSRPGWFGVLLVMAGALAGLIGTVLTGSEPGLILAAGLILGTVCGAVAVHPRATYLIIPVPVLAYVVAATVAGLIHDHAIDTSRAALAVGLTQWIAGGFLTMIAATLLTIAIAAIRWLGSRHTML